MTGLRLSYVDFLIYAYYGLSLYLPLITLLTVIPLTDSSGP